MKEFHYLRARQCEKYLGIDEIMDDYVANAKENQAFVDDFESKREVILEGVEELKSRISSLAYQNERYDTLLKGLFAAYLDGDMETQRKIFVALGYLEGTLPKESQQ